MGVSREGEQSSGFLLGNPIYHVLAALGMDNLHVGFSAQSSLQVILQQRIAAMLGFVRTSDSKSPGGPQTETGSWQLLTHSPRVHKIRANCVAKGEGKGLKVGDQTIGITGALMYSLAKGLGKAQLTLISGLLVECKDLGPREECSDAEVVFRHILHQLGPALSTVHFEDAGTGALKQSNKVAAAGKLDKKKKNVSDSSDSHRSSGIHSIRRAKKPRTGSPVISHKRTDVTLVVVSSHADLPPALTVTCIHSFGVASGLLLSFLAPLNTSGSLLRGGLGARQVGNLLVISWDRKQALKRCVAAAATVANGSGTSSSTLKNARQVF